MPLAPARPRPAHPRDRAPRPFGLPVLTTPLHATLAIAILLSGLPVRAGGLVTSCDPTALEAALVGGGRVVLECSGSIQLLRTLVIAADTEIEGPGVPVVLDGADAVRLLHVQPGIRLTLRHLTLARGRHTGELASTNQARTDAEGGAILVDRGHLIASDCLFLNNQAVGGDNALPIGTMVGGSAFGGAVSLRGATAAFTRCRFVGNRAQGGPLVLSPQVRLGGELGHGQGGAIALQSGSSARLAETLFERNTAAGASAQGLNSGTGGSAYGGAIEVIDGRLDAEGCRFLGNATLPGGAPRSSRAGLAGGGALRVPNATAEVRIVRSHFETNVCRGGSAVLGNTAAQGGAILNAGTLAAEATTFLGNQALGAAEAQGGAIASSGTLHLDGTTFEANLAAGGVGGGPAGVPGYPAEGGALQLTGTASVRNSAFLSNTSRGGDGNSIVGQRLSNGGPGSGGAIHALAQLHLANATFLHNAAIGGAAGHPSFTTPGPALGGALRIAGGAFDGSHLTIASNLANNGSDTAAGAGISRATASLSSLTNSILQANLANTNPANCSGGFTTSSGGLSSDATCSFATQPTTLPGLDSTDARLAPGIDRSGPTPFLALLSDSPALDAATGPACPQTEDQRGANRPYGPGCDLGAVELQPPGSLRGRITGLPDPTQARVLIGNQTVTPDPDGWYRADNLAPGRTTISVTLDTFRFWPRTAALPLGGTPQQQNFQTRAPGTLSLERSPLDDLTLVFAGEPAVTYTVESSPDLTRWSSETTAQADDSGWLILPQPRPTTAGTASRFLRIHRP